MAGTYLTLRRLVRALRIQRGWTQEQLSERAGVDYKYYQLFESARTPTPALQTVECLASVFELKPWVLLCDEPELVTKLTGVDVGVEPEVRKPGRPRKAAK